jgi:hypothetical protein
MKKTLKFSAIIISVCMMGCLFSAVGVEYEREEEIFYNHRVDFFYNPIGGEWVERASYCSTNNKDYYDQIASQTKHEFDIFERIEAGERRIVYAHGDGMHESSFPYDDFHPESANRLADEAVIGKCINFSCKS